SSGWRPPGAMLTAAPHPRAKPIHDWSLTAACRRPWATVSTTGESTQHPRGSDYPFHQNRIGASLGLCEYSTGGRPTPIWERRRIRPARRRIRRDSRRWRGGGPANRRSPAPRVAGRTAPPWRRPQLTVVTNALSIALECATDAQMKVDDRRRGTHQHTLHAVGRWRSWHFRPPPRGPLSS